MKAKNQNKLISAILITVLGVLFLIWKSDVISVAMTVLGVMLIVQGILDLVHKNIVSGVIRVALGILIIVFGWAFVTIALYVMAVVLLIYGIMQLISTIRNLASEKSLVAKIVGFIQPALYLVIAACLLFNQSGAITWVFILSGIFLIIQGVLALIDCLSSKS